MKTSTFLMGSLALLAAAAFLPTSCSSSDNNTNPVDSGGGDTATDTPTDTKTDTSTDSPTDTGDTSETGATVARGEYLVKHLLVCGDCHTTPDATGNPSTNPADFLAGGRDFPVPGEAGVGHVYSRNLTSDATTGLGLWSVADIKQAITKGLDKDGAPLFPIMPYAMFGNLTDDDATSVAMYIKSLPAKSNTVPEPTVHVPAPAPVYDDTKIPHTTLPSSDASFASAERGRYLAKVICVECHTQDDASGRAPDFTKAFAGGRLFPLGPITSVSANLTPDPSALATWTPADIVATLKADAEKGAAGRHLCPPMPGGPDRLGGLNDADLADIAAFIHTVPAVANVPTCATTGCCNGTKPTDAGDAGDAADGG